MARICYQPCKFQARALALIEICNQIIVEYQRAGFVLTLRQLYYQLVSRDVIPNKQSEYHRVGSIVNDARLAGMMDWAALEDRTRNIKSIAHWDSPEQIVSAVADQYRTEKWSSQLVVPEVWIEKDALVGVIQPVCDQEDVAYFSCRGYVSQSEMHDAAQRFIRRAHKGQGTQVIHLGDHDASGQDMSRDIEERIRMFMTHHLKSSSMFQFKRIALNMDQIRQYNPPPNPAKSTDPRFQAYVAKHGDESWELDALNPTVLADLIRQEVTAVRNARLWKVAIIDENKDREMLGKVSENWWKVSDFVEGLDA